MGSGQEFVCPLAYARWDVPVAQIHRSRLQNCMRLNNWNYAPFFVLLSSAVVVAYADPIALLIERLLAAAGIRGLLVVPALLLILFALLLQQRALHATSKSSKTPKLSGGMPGGPRSGRAS